MAGTRSEYLLQLLRGLDGERSRLVIVSFNRPEGYKLHDNATLPTLTKSFEAAGSMGNLKIWPMWVRAKDGRGAAGGNHYMKTVFVETMARTWDLLRGYDGDAAFLEDDLRVSPDFFSALKAASQIKRANDVGVFAMGGWAGQNTGSFHHPEAQHFVLKTW